MFRHLCVQVSVLPAVQWNEGMHATQQMKTWVTPLLSLHLDPLLPCYLAHLLPSSMLTHLVDVDCLLEPLALHPALLGPL
jgi:hypothetical protein